MTDKKPDQDHYFTEHPESRLRLGIVRTCLRSVQFEFLTGSSVFSKSRVDTGTRLLIESMVLPDSGYVLDMGCGYGAVGIAAATFNPRLYVEMTDVNSRAVYLARENLKRNRVVNAEVKQGHLYTPFKDSVFSCILSNPPVSAGMTTIKAIVTEAPSVMEKGGSLQMVVKSKIGGKILPTVLEDTFGNCEVIARESGYRVLMAKKE